MITRRRAAAALALLCLPSALPAQETVAGTLSRIWIDARTYAPADRPYVFVLHADDGSTYSLADPASVSVVERSGAAVGDRLILSGTADGAPGARQFRAGTARRGTQLSNLVAPPQSGLIRWVTILCRLPDVATQPKPLAYYQTIMGPARPGAEHYWNEVATGQIQVDGATVIDWQTLPQPTSYYFPNGVQRDPVWSRIATDCMGLANAQVDFTQFHGVNLQLNMESAASWGGASYVTYDGVNRVMPTTWLAQWSSPHVYAHEMGHAFGLPHSSGPYDQTYDSKWDVMSSYSFYDHTLRDWIGQHTNGSYKALLGWVPAARRHTVHPGTAVRFVLERGGVAPPTGFLLANVPISTQPGYYHTIDARQQIGYDQGVPASGVVIHRNEAACFGVRDRCARVVDVDNNNDPNDAGAVWTPGEALVDSITGLRVQVHGATATGYDVTIGNGWRLRTTVTGSGRIQASTVGECSASCETLFASRHTTVQLAPIATQSGWHFAHWSGDCSGSGACVVSLAGDRTVGAVFAQRVAIMSDSLRSVAVVGAVHVDSLRRDGGDGNAVWSVTGGTLPFGLTLNATDGVISGVAAAAGSYRFTVTVTSAGTSDERTFVKAAYNAVAIAGDSVRPLAVMGTQHTDTFAASGGDGTFVWTAQSALPPGLTLSPAGVLTGTPTAAGTFVLTVRATSATLSATRAFSVRVSAPVSIQSAALRKPATLGAPYADTLQATGGIEAIMWSLTGGSLPRGITLHPATGVLTGIPENKGTVTFTLTASSTGLTQTREFSITVTSPVLAPAMVEQQLFTHTGLAQDQLRYLDLIGNRNGRFDIGDVRAWLIDTNQLPANATPAEAVGALQRAAARQRAGGR